MTLIIRKTLRFSPENQYARQAANKIVSCKIRVSRKNSFPVSLELIEFSGLNGGPHISEKGLIKMEIMQGI